MEAKSLAIWLSVVVVLSSLGAVVASSGSTSAVKPSYTFPTPIQHVFVIMLENEEQSTVIGQGPYESALSHEYVQTSNYYSECHNSTPNYIAGITGNVLGCGVWARNSTTGDVYEPFEWYDANNTTLVGEIESAGLTWDAYMEGQTKSCQQGNVGTTYAYRHDPFAEIWSIAKDTTAGDKCSEHEYSFNQATLGLWAMVNNSTWPNYAMIVPGLWNDGHNDGVMGADEWLQNFLSYLQTKSNYASTAVFVTYDESEDADDASYSAIESATKCVTHESAGHEVGGTPAAVECGGHTYMQVVSKYSTPTYYGALWQAQDQTDFNVLSSSEWLLGLGAVGTESSPSNSATFGPDECVFSFGSDGSNGGSCGYSGG